MACPAVLYGMFPVLFLVYVKNDVAGVAADQHHGLHGQMIDCLFILKGLWQFDLFTRPRPILSVPDNGTVLEPVSGREF